MSKIIISLLLSVIAVSLAANTPAIRFVNAIENVTLDIYTNTFKTISLNYTGVSNYESVTGGSIQVTNVINHVTGVSYTGANPQLIGVLSNNTLAFYMVNGTIQLVMFNETTPSTIDDSKAWIRFIDLATTSEFVTLADTDGAIASYVGPLVNTPYQSIDVTTTSVRLYASAGSYNTPYLLLNTSFNASCAYTVFYFTPDTEHVAYVAFDRSFAGWSAPISSTSSSSSSSTTSSMTSKSSTGVIAATTGVAQASSTSSSSTSSSSTSSSSTSSSSTTTTGQTIAHTSSATQVLLGFTALVGLICAF